MRVKESHHLVWEGNDTRSTVVGKVDKDIVVGTTEKRMREGVRGDGGNGSHAKRKSYVVSMPHPLRGKNLITCATLPVTFKVHCLMD